LFHPVWTLVALDIDLQVNKQFLENYFQKLPNPKLLGIPSSFPPKPLSCRPRGQTDPTRQPPRAGAALTGGFLAAGGVSGDGGSTARLDSPSHTRWCPRLAQRHTGGGSPATRQTTTTGWWCELCLQPREAESARARASLGPGEAVARVRRAVGCGGEDGCNTLGVCHSLSSGFELKHDRLSEDDDVKVNLWIGAPT
jgi:hypothetical protein